MSRKSQCILVAGLLCLSSAVAAQTGTIVIEKSTTPAGGVDFQFNNDVGLPNPFLLDDGQSRTFINVPVGSYNVTEADPAPLFQLSAVSCDDGNSSGNVAARTAVIQLEADETVTCTFTNDETLGTVVIVKETMPAAGDAAFDFNSTLGASFTLVDGQSKTFSDVVPGAHTVTEASPLPAFFITSIACDDANSTGDPATGIANLQVEPNETVTCTFTAQVAGTSTPLLGPWGIGILVALLGLGGAVFQRARA